MARRERDRAEVDTPCKTGPAALVMLPAQKGGTAKTQSGPPTCVNTRTALTSQLMVNPDNRRGCRGSCHSPPRMKGGCDMPDDVKTTIDELANSLQTVTLLSTQLRCDLNESAQRAVELEAEIHAVGEQRLIGVGIEYSQPWQRVVNAVARSRDSSTPRISSNCSRVISPAA